MKRRPLRPLSHPGLLNQRPHRRRRSYRPQPDPRHGRPKGIATLWTRIRRFAWWWFPWATLCVYFIDQRAWWWALGAGLWAGVCSLSTPQEFPPQYGLEHDLDVGSPDFIDTMAGAAGIPFFDGNRIDLLNNGDAFYPAMLRDIELAERSITIEAYIYWAGEIGLKFAKALAAAARRGVKVKLLLDAIGSQSIGNEIVRILDDGGSIIAPTASRSSSTAGWDTPAGPASPISGRARRRTTSIGAISRSGSRVQRCGHCRAASRTTGSNARANW
jgi:hypothetical protein